MVALALPTDKELKSELRALFLAQLPKPTDELVKASLPVLLQGKKLKEPSELEEDIARLLALKEVSANIIFLNRSLDLIVTNELHILI